MTYAVCAKCDAHVWRFNSGRVWYASSPQGKRIVRAAICQADGVTHVARRGTVKQRGGDASERV